MNGKGYFVVHEWMITDLGLRGVELLVYAIIYGFTQIEEQKFFGTRRYLSSMSGSSVRSVQDALNSLVDKGLLAKEVSRLPHGGIQYVSYSAVLHPGCKNCRVAETAHNDNIHNSISIEVTSSKTNRFIKPTVAEVEAYCREKGYAVDAAYFVDYYNSKGWVVGKSPMKDWKAAIRTWVRNRSPRNAQVSSRPNEPNWGDD